MPQRNTLVRSLDDVGSAAWFGGLLMGAVELNGAAATVKGSKKRIAVATTGLEALGSRADGSICRSQYRRCGVDLGDTAGLACQPEERVNTTVKLIPLVAIGYSVYAGFFGGQMAAYAGESAPGITEPSSIRQRNWRPRRRSSVCCSWSLQRSP
ncbi:hypothetical protein [Cryobacterium sp. Y11]|uniref:hypothetical protein n=1 Tax=Cryobacterium sp. Y11 TaxID=2045016 RepID=UPI000CE49E43|nr:hypothetical protein [Cryobacterium sp. Y11]